MLQPCVLGLCPGWQRLNLVWFHVAVAALLGCTGAGAAAATLLRAGCTVAPGYPCEQPVQCTFPSR